MADDQPDWKRWTRGGILGFIGFLLSPLSWWNDLFVNVPLAVAFGWSVALFFPGAFKIAVIAGYWITNLFGFILMQKGAEKIVNKESSPYPRHKLLRDIGLSLAYTVLIWALIEFQIIKPFDFSFADPN